MLDDLRIHPALLKPDLYCGRPEMDLHLLLHYNVIHAEDRGL
jgi:hypothetical protein